jgi:tetratricopeptide (TPR) repeat protein
VQKAADQVRVNVKLINAQTDSHLWAESYDRKLIDIFEVESEIAKRIAESLQAKLTSYEERALAFKPTNNPDAYEAYLRGLAFEAGGYSYESLPKIIHFYEQAVQLDPNFALAWARLSRADSYRYFRSDFLVVPTTTPAGGTAVAHGDAAKKALENAQKLQPNSPETLLALGYYQYWVLGDFGLAKSTFGRVSKTLPGSSEVPYALGLVSRHEGQWDESIADLEQALVLDPRNSDILDDTAQTYAMLRQFPTALKLYDRALDIRPNDENYVAKKIKIYQAQGNLRQAAKLLEDVNARTSSAEAFTTKVKQLALERNLGEAIRLLQARLTQLQFGPFKGHYQVWLATLRGLAGDTAGAKASAEEALKTLEPFDEPQPGDPNTMVALSLAKAELGEKNSALKDAERAIALAPSNKNPIEGPGLEEHLARIYTLFDENGRAISILTRLLQTPYSSIHYHPLPVTPAFLRLDPIWDPLRGDPAFQKLCAEK